MDLPRGVLFTFVRDEDRSAIYCRASRTGFLCCCCCCCCSCCCCFCCCCCYPLQLFLSLVLANNHHIGGVFPFFLESKQHHKIPMSLAPRKPKSMVFTICFLRLVIITTVFTVFFCPAPSKSTGIYAVFSMLQEVLLDTKGTKKNVINYSVFGMHTHKSTNKYPKWTFQTLPWQQALFLSMLCRLLTLEKRETQPEWRILGEGRRQGLQPDLQCCSDS